MKKKKVKFTGLWTVLAKYVMKQRLFSVQPIWTIYNRTLNRKVAHCT